MVNFFPIGYNNSVTSYKLFLKELFSIEAGHFQLIIWYNRDITLNLRLLTIRFVGSCRNNHISSNFWLVFSPDQIAAEDFLWVSSLRYTCIIFHVQQYCEKCVLTRGCTKKISCWEFVKTRILVHKPPPPPPPTIEPIGLICKEMLIICKQVVVVILIHFQRFCYMFWVIFNLFLRDFFNILIRFFTIL